MRWRHFERGRPAGMINYLLTPRPFRRAAFVRLAAAVDAAGATLRAETPEPGWVARFSRDGKYYPCDSSAQGAEPAWIWTGDVL